MNDSYAWLDIDIPITRKAMFTCGAICGRCHVSMKIKKNTVLGTTGRVDYECFICGSIFSVELHKRSETT
jgi:hypothetical protein